MKLLSSKSKILVALLIVVPSCASAQTWDCRTFFGLGDVAVTVSKAANANTWQISLPDTDVRHSARYEVRGLERFWTFGSTDGRSPAFAFGISPSEEGIYYIRGSANEWVKQDTYTCEDRQVIEQREREQQERDRAAREAAALRQREEQARAERERVAREAAAQADAQAALAAEAERAEAEMAAEYVRMIESRIKQHWRRPRSARPGIECVVEVVQLQTGDVMSAVVESCNGDDDVRQSIVRAVLDASPLPKPPDPSLFNRNLRVNFRPDE